MLSRKGNFARVKKTSKALKKSVQTSSKSTDRLITLTDTFQSVIVASMRTRAISKRG
jgi:hypothetical protein